MDKEDDLFVQNDLIKHDNCNDTKILNPIVISDPLETNSTSLINDPTKETDPQKKSKVKTDSIKIKNQHLENADKNLNLGLNQLNIIESSNNEHSCNSETEAEAEKEKEKEKEKDQHSLRPDWVEINSDNLSMDQIDKVLTRLRTDDFDSLEQIKITLEILKLNNSISAKLKKDLRALKDKTNSNFYSLVYKFLVMKENFIF
mmetsp:Transcript_73764/g.159513  ORF Transcript_73764/g.159513 Transcript_73764/m.159513 type:complete len:202 (-) Transcript_73764:201-806(-)